MNDLHIIQPVPDSEFEGRWKFLKCPGAAMIRLVITCKQFQVNGEIIICGDFNNWIGNLNDNLGNASASERVSRYSYQFSW